MALAQAELRFWHGTDEDPMPAAEHALAINPELAEGHCVKARYLENQGRAEESDKELEEALRLAPDSWEVNREGASLMFKRGRMRESSHFFEKAAQLMDSDFHSTSMLITCYIGMEDEESARGAAKRTLERAEAAVARDPTNGAALAAGATSLMMYGEIERGKDWIQRALLLDPDNMSVLYNLACGLTFRNADLDGAMDLLEPWFERLDSPAFIRHAEIDPDIDPIRDHPRYKEMVGSARKRLKMPAEA
jgi:adenylate cyclase